jgi:hypothetical protein
MPMMELILLGRHAGLRVKFAFLMELQVGRAGGREGREGGREGREGVS